MIVRWEVGVLATIKTDNNNIVVINCKLYLHLHISPDQEHTMQGCEIGKPQ